MLANYPAKPQLSLLPSLAVVCLCFTGISLLYRWNVADHFFNGSLLFYETGNPLLRADVLLKGGSLYGDIAYTYGPLPILAYTGLAWLLGNTPNSLFLWHCLSSAVTVLLAFFIAVRYLSRHWAAAFTLFICLPVLMIPAGLIGALTNTECISSERICLLLLLLLWQPPEERSLRRSLAIGASLGAWQLIKFGGAVFAGAALVLVDLLWLLRANGGAAWRSWLASLAAGLAAFLVIEGSWAAFALYKWPGELALDILWPLYASADYSYSKPSYFSRYDFLTRQLLPLASALVSAAMLVLLLRRSLRPSPKASSADTAPPWAGLMIAPLFYLLAMPFYFGHEALYYQYAFALVFGPLAAMAVLRTAWLKSVVLLIGTASIAAMLKTAVLGYHNEGFKPWRLPDGTSITMSQTEISLSERLLALAQEHPGQFPLMVCLWRGGGFLHYYVPHYPLRNYFFTASAFKASDAQQLAAQLENISAIVVCQDQPGAGQLGTSFGQILPKPLVEAMSQGFERIPGLEPAYYWYQRRKQ